MLRLISLFTLFLAFSCQPSSGSSIPLPEPETDKDADQEQIAEPEEEKKVEIAITSLSLKEYPGIESKIDNSQNTIYMILPTGAFPGKATIIFETTEGVTAVPESGSVVDITKDVAIDLSVEGQETETWTLKVSVDDMETAVRGIYLPARHHTASFSTYGNAKASLDLMASLNFNCLFVCVWANSKTAWDSEVLMANSNLQDISQTNMYSSYAGGSGDALRDIIELAHERDIKVIFWFEYGFMHNIGGVNKSDCILSKHPEWIGIGNDGNPSNYNGTDFYLNSYDPQVQEFMLALMEEALEKYPEVDGIQGDDRLPAMPRNSGYDAVTSAAYKADKGVEPPQNFDDPQWVRWRLDNLNSFARNMYSRLKAVRKDLYVCYAPNKYPWCEGVLMQEWPAWIKDGVVDLLTVQFYVLPTYEKDIKDALGHISANGGVNLLNPAMILKNGSRIMEESVLKGQLQFNRSVGTNGESQFWFDGLKTPYVQEVFREFYPTKARFPELKQ